MYQITGYFLHPTPAGLEIPSISLWLGTQCFQHGLACSLVDNRATEYQGLPLECGSPELPLFQPMSRLNSQSAKSLKLLLPVFVILAFHSKEVGTWRSLVAHLNGVQGVASSNLAVPTKVFLCFLTLIGSRSQRLPTEETFGWYRDCQVSN